MAQAHPRFKVHSVVHGPPALEHWWFKTMPPLRSFWPIRRHVLRRAPFLPRPLPSPWERSECPVPGLKLWFWSNRVADIVWTEYLSWSLFLSRGSVGDADSQEHRTRSRQGREELWRKREGQVSRSRSGLEISDSSVGRSFTTALPKLKLKGKERGGRGNLDPRAGVFGAASAETEVWMRNGGRPCLRGRSGGPVDPALQEQFVCLNPELQIYKLWRPLVPRGECKPVLLLEHHESVFSLEKEGS